jgi:hypothetical protein
MNEVRSGQVFSHNNFGYWIIVLQVYSTYIHYISMDYHRSGNINVQNFYNTFTQVPELILALS